jgi:hypothetical protein
MKRSNSSHQRRPSPRKDQTDTHRDPISRGTVASSASALRCRRRGAGPRRRRRRIGIGKDNTALNGGARGAGASVGRCGFVGGEGIGGVRSESPGLTVQRHLRDIRILRRVDNHHHPCLAMTEGSLRAVEPAGVRVVDLYAEHVGLTII